ncbi:hypothetical protein [Brevibacillus nitrificans]|uniref:hypothetical protein n=1 Tax=Brevibacillus nitrificans TaxID=651560 RepID=UPI0028561BAA|nr:hypothetical protein [Brevibacillus nitrificans]MDR7319657.1 hypothetical protein [Brevibacillus nitrificans]
MKKTSDSTGSTSFPSQVQLSGEEKIRSQILNHVLETEKMQDEENQKQEDNFFIER